ncbi:MAG: TIGR02921 family PEP-CTERM protein [Spirulinaceae cyanobacterium]
MKTIKKPQGKLKSFLNISGAGVFWFWNLAFLLVIYGGLLPLLGTGFWLAGLRGEIEREFFFVFVAILLIPLATVAIARLTFSLEPNKLIRLFYGLEAPLILLLLIRLFILRELTPASHLVIGTLLVCLLGFFVELVNGYGEENRLLASLQLGVHTLMLLVGVGVGILLAFYAVPIGAFFWEWFWDFYWLTGIWRALTQDWISWIEFIIYGAPMILLFILSATLFILMPLFWVTFYIKSGTRIIQRFRSDYGKKATISGVLGVLTAWFILFVGFNHQPQTQAFELLNKSPQTNSEKTALLKKTPTIRRGLINAYLYSYRYLSPGEDSNSIAYLYRNAFDLNESASQIFQDGFNTLISPFLYQGSSEDNTKAEQLYEEFFDLPIQKGEKDAIRHALKSTFILDEAKAGVLNIDEKRVWLKSQDITLTPQGDWAEIELYEVYENQTNDVEEILYYFSLPESAVVTGVWLGDSADRDKRFTFQVSPRGAAQKVYNSQVRRERPVDPALLEQVGPRNYRLRAFPVPPRLPLGQQPADPEAPTQMHLWLTYKVMQQPQGWALPKLAERRNIFWTKASLRSQNGAKVKGDGKNWLPAFLPAQKPYQPQKQQISLSEGYRLTATPLTEKDYVLPKKESLAIILDTSHSMGENSQKVEETFTWLKKNGFSDADLYLTATGKYAPQFLDDIQSFPANKQVFYGKLQLKEMLYQFVKLQGNNSYNNIIVLTDASNYELADDSKDVPDIKSPLWVVHLGDSLAPAYDDASLKVIQDSQGGVATALPEVLKRAATQSQLGSNVIDNYSWSVTTTQAEATTKQDFAPLATRQLIKSLSAQSDGNSVKELDKIHNLAKKYAIVTPYSSMIVLVNDEQRQALKAAEAEDDRFDRTVEDGKEELAQPGNPLDNTSNVPEPGLILAVIMTIPFALVFRRYKQKLAK